MMHQMAMRMIRQVLLDAGTEGSKAKTMAFNSCMRLPPDVG